MNNKFVKSAAACCSVTQSCLTLFDPVDCSTPGFPILHHLPEFAQTHVRQVDDAIQPTHPLSFPFFSCLQYFLASVSFPMSQLFTSSGQRIGASASVLPMNIQTGNSAQYSMAGWMGGESVGEWLPVYIWLGPFPVRLKPSQHC